MRPAVAAGAGAAGAVRVSGLRGDGGLRAQGQPVAATTDPLNIIDFKINDLELNAG
jgi:hypothetical protein